MILSRLWQYQKERFPIFAHGMLIFSFSFSAMCISSLLRGNLNFPAPGVILAGFLCSFCFFLQLRITDEFKDYDEDLAHRPYRPVQRGLVSLTELGIVGILSGMLQILICLWLNPKLLALLLMVWCYLTLMGKEFFIGSWLHSRPLAYMLSHMLIMPMIDFFITSCEWLLYQPLPPRGIIWFVFLSFINGMIIEIGRKIRSPEDEEQGVQTYSGQWGRSLSTCIFLGCVLLSGLYSIILGIQIHFFAPMMITCSILFISAVLLALGFLRQPSTGRGKWFERFSGVWTIITYNMTGSVPLIVGIFQ